MCTQSVIKTTDRLTVMESRIRGVVEIKFEEESEAIRSEIREERI